MNVRVHVGFRCPANQANVVGIDRGTDQNPTATVDPAGRPFSRGSAWKPAGAGTRTEPGGVGKVWRTVASVGTGWGAATDRLECAAGPVAMAAGVAVHPQAENARATAGTAPICRMNWPPVAVIDICKRCDAVVAPLVPHGFAPNVRCRCERAWSR